MLFGGAHVPHGGTSCDKIAEELFEFSNDMAVILCVCIRWVLV